jgi:nucleotidyltransferase/DNA polymerase involved in DNA repair
MTSSNKPAIIHIRTSGKNFSQINYSRRMYAIIRRYTPNVAEGVSNECFADLTGLRTFFKMSYAEMTDKILKDLKTEIGVSFTVKVSSVDAFDAAKNKSKKQKSVSTYKELNKLFAGKAFTAIKNRKCLRTKRKLTIPFLGKVS